LILKTSVVIRDSERLKIRQFLPSRFLMLIFKLPFNYLHLIYVEQGLVIVHHRTVERLQFAYLGPSLTYKSFQNSSQRCPFLTVFKTDLVNVHPVNCQRYRSLLQVWTGTRHPIPTVRK
jgi:hypothetical protein